MLFILQSDFIGGAEVILHILLSNIDIKKFKCFLLFYKNGEVSRYFSGIPAERIIIENRDKRSKFIREIAGSIKIDLAYFYSFSTLRETILIKSLNIPVIFHEHNIYSPARNIYPFSEPEETDF